MRGRKLTDERLSQIKHVAGSIGLSTNHSGGMHTELLDHIEYLEGLLDGLSAKYKALVKWYDKQVGTPCEQIRHQQEIQDLVDKYDKLASLDAIEIAGLQTRIRDLERVNFDYELHKKMMEDRIEWLTKGCFMLMSVMNGRGVDRDSAERAVYDEWRKGGHLGV